MHDGLEAVPVRVHHEGRVVARVVVLPDARRPVVGAAGGERSDVEGVDRRAVRGHEGEVQAALGQRRAVGGGSPADGRPLA